MPKKTPRSGWRDEVLARDNYECQFSQLLSWFPVRELADVPCLGELQAHHKTYERYGQELPEDGVTLCQGHHDIVTDVTRRLRYHARKAQVELRKDVRMVKPTPGKEKESEETEFYHRGSSTVVDAQRSPSRSRRSVQQEDGRDHVQQEEDRRRLRRTESAGLLGRPVP